jgi:hypothetical protein
MLQFELESFPVWDRLPLPLFILNEYCSMTEAPQHQAQQQPVHVWGIDSVEVVSGGAFEVPSIVSISSDDDSTHVSSVSSAEDDEYGQDNDEHVYTLHGSIQQERRRVLFGGYWNAARGESGIHSKAVKEADSCSCHAHDAGPNRTAGERSGNKHERISLFDVPTCKERDRRKIFHFASYDTLHPVSWPPNTGNLPHCLESGTAARARSMSDSWSDSQPSSCLRRSRFAPGFSRRELSSGGSNMSTTLVSFHPVVEIVTYEIPVEHWACEGWMQYFA